MNLRVLSHFALLSPRNVVDGDIGVGLADVALINGNHAVVSFR